MMSARVFLSGTLTGMVVPGTTACGFARNASSFVVVHLNFACFIASEYVAPDTDPA